MFEPTLFVPGVGEVEVHLYRDDPWPEGEEIDYTVISPVPEDERLDHYDEVGAVIATHTEEWI